MAVPLPLPLVTLDVYLRNVLSATRSKSLLASCSGTCWYVDDDEEAEDDTGSDLANEFIPRNNRILVEVNVDLEELMVVLRERNGSDVQWRMAMYNVGVGFC